MLNALIQGGDLGTVVKYLGSFTNGRCQHVGMPKGLVTKEGKDMLKSKHADTVLDMFHRWTDVSEDHTPHTLTNDRWIGVEIECCIPWKSLDLDESAGECEYCDGHGNRMIEDEDGNESEDECCECEGTGSNSDSYSKGHKALKKYFSANKVTFTSIKSDGSLSVPDNSYFAVEVTVLTRLNKSYNLKKVCDLLNKLGAKVNASCGMHVHLDARHLSKKQVVNKGEDFECAIPVLKSLVPKSRHNNQYCHMSVSSLEGQRYHAVNLTAWTKHRTIEIRCHSSTTDFNKIIQWARFLN